jgi:iron complex transport system ATP-binding protein
VSAVLEFADVTFHRESNQILTGINWSVNEGQHWIIVGPNGAGKSTLMAIAAARLYPSSGYASVLGEILGLTDVFELRQRIGLASSSAAQLIDDEENVLNAVRTAAYAMSGSWQETYEDADNDRALRLLRDWNLEHSVKRRWVTLSEGEKKRLLIARAMMSDPEVLMLDEPAAGLDVSGREQLINAIHRLTSSPASPVVVMVTHHVDEIPSSMTHALLLKQGEILAAGEIESVMTSQNLSELFDYQLNLFSHDTASGKRWTLITR